MNDDWLSKEISQIISSPHISFPKPAGSLPFRMGPGPVDVFSTKFDNAFASDVKGTFAGKEVSREELKTKLLGLQKHWNAEDVKFRDGSAGLVGRGCSLSDGLQSLTVRAKRYETVVHLSGKIVSLSAEWVQFIPRFVRWLTSCHR